MENLIFWFDNPPTCSKGIWKIVNSKWEKECTLYVFLILGKTD